MNTNVILGLLVPSAILAAGWALARWWRHEAGLPNQRGCWEPGCDLRICHTGMHRSQDAADSWWSR